VQSFLALAQLNVSLTPQGDSRDRMRPYKQLLVAFYYRRRLLMGVLLERKTQVIFVTASSVEQDGKAREVIVESRPLYAVVQLSGSKEKYPVAWEMIYKLAKERHAENLRLEAQSQSKLGRIRHKKILE
jgi:hypothetical protein